MNAKDSTAKNRNSSKIYLILKTQANYKNGNVV